MAVFKEEYFKSTEKMADAVMEYAAQFIAQDYLEEYKKADEDTAGDFVPVLFDAEMEPILKKAAARSGGYRLKALKRVMRWCAVVWVLLTGVCFIVVMAAPSMREALWQAAGQLWH